MLRLEHHLKIFGLTILHRNENLQRSMEKKGEIYSLNGSQLSWSTNLPLSVASLGGGPKGVQIDRLVTSFCGISRREGGPKGVQIQKSANGGSSVLRFWP